MEKEFIPYEQALALQELGFNEPCFKYKDNTNFRPLYQQAFRWFRDKHKMYFPIQKTKTSFGHLFFCDKILEERKEIDTMFRYFNTYEEAELECLKKLIEIVKKQKNV